jgi:tetratricopeptide (TPR) repeat protein
MSRPDDYDELVAAVCAGFESCRVHRDRSPSPARRSDAAFLSGFGATLSDLGRARDDRRLTELAELAFSGAREVAPDWRFLANHAVVLERLERFEEAAEIFGRAAALDPDQAELLARRASCLHEAEDLDAARDAYLAYLDAKPDDAHEWISLAIVESDMGRYDEAQKAYWRAGGLEPNNLSLHYNWFITAVRAGQSELAQDACRRLNAIDASDWRSGLAAANVLERSGDPAAGFRRAIEIFDREMEACDLSDAEDRSRLDHIATWTLDIAASCDRADGDAFVERLCRDWVLGDEVLAAIRKREAPERAELAAYSVLVEAVAAAPEPATDAYILRYQVFADSPSDAARLAVAFERRCGANRARAAEVEPLDEDRHPRHRGPAWRAATAYSFPIDEYGKD